MFKITNISSESRKFRIHKTAESFLLRPGEEMEIPHLPVVNRPDIFKIIDLSRQTEEKKEVSEKKIKFKGGKNK